MEVVGLHKMSREEGLVGDWYHEGSIEFIPCPTN